MPALRRRRFAVPVTLAVGVTVLAALMLVAGQAAGPAGPELAAPGGVTGVTAAASAGGPVDVGNGVRVGMAVRHDRSPSLRQIPAEAAHLRPVGSEEDGGGAAHATPAAKDPVVQTAAATTALPATSLNFDGIGFPGVNCNCAPPDTNGEPGATQYVQIVNDGFQVFDKGTGASVFGPVAVGTIWTGFGGVCELSGDGDPVVLWDQLAGRWLVSQFAGSSVPTDECIAVSTSSDASGSWYRYDFHLGSSFYDYPKLAVWSDGYYMSDNVFNSAGTSYLGPQPFVFNRAAMLAGQAATFQTTAPMGSSIDPILPADVEGSAQPPANAPETFVRFPGAGAYQTYHYHVDWTTPANSTFTTFAAPAAAGFTLLCPTTRSCVPQRGTTAGLDALADRLMFRLSYRNFGDHESVVGNYTVSSGGVAAVRWFELRGVTAGPETVYQESTYQPDTTWRWMGSTAMDQSGDIAVGFNASSGSVFPQLRYAARLAGDPLNSLAQGEATLFAGTGSQTGTSNRWGDYSDLTVDPVDGCTFWYTSEYYAATTSFGWHTRIGAFRLSSCGSSTTGSITGHVTDSTTAAAIAGATVAISGGPSTTTDSSGAYTLSGLAPASYSVTASKSGYTTSAPAADTVTAGSTVTQDFALVPNPTAPSAPTGLTATVGNATVALAWTAPANSGGSPITGYKVYRGTVSGGETLLTTLGTVTTYSDAGVTNGTTYYYNVSAVNAIGESGLSNEASATPATVPGAPTGLGATGGVGTVHLAWTAPASNGGSAISGYQVWRGTASGAETLLTTIGNVTSYDDTVAAGTYFYKVAAVNAVGPGPVSNETQATATASTATVPGAPQSLAARPATGKGIQLTWTAPASNGGSAINGYIVYRGTSTGAETARTTLGVVTSYKDTTTTRGVTYYYTVAAVNAIGTGPKSNEASATAK